MQIKYGVKHDDGALVMQCSGNAGADDEAAVGLLMHCWFQCLVDVGAAVIISGLWVLLAAGSGAAAGLLVRVSCLTLTHFVAKGCENEDNARDSNNAIANKTLQFATCCTHIATRYIINRWVLQMNANVLMLYFCNLSFLYYLPIYLFLYKRDLSGECTTQKYT